MNSIRHWMGFKRIGMAYRHKTSAITSVKPIGSLVVGIVRILLPPLFECLLLLMIR